MKITMLGASGSGKTSYMSMMMQQFVNDTQNGFYLVDSSGNIEQEVYLKLLIDKVSTIINGKFPDSTVINSVLQLVLMHNTEEVIDIDWIDYKGGLIKNIDLNNSDTNEILATLISSDVILVFVDTEFLATEENEYQVKSKTGINDLIFLLNLVYKKTNASKLNVLFVLSKADSNHSQAYGEDRLISRCHELFKPHFSRCPRNARYAYVCVGSIGINRVKSTVNETIDTFGNSTRRITNEIISSDIAPYNIAASFAYCLYMACVSAIESTANEIADKSSALNQLCAGFDSVQRIIDFLFCKSKKRYAVHSLKRAIELEQVEVAALDRYRDQLYQIWKGVIKTVPTL